MMPIKPRLKSASQGVALVEFALILPLLLILTFMTTEFGRALYEYNTVTKSVRDAVRYLSFQAPGSGTVVASNLIVYGNPGGTGAPLAVGLSTANVATPVWQSIGANPQIDVVTVRVTGYQFVPLITGFWGLNFAAFTFSDITASMRVPL